MSTHLPDRLVGYQERILGQIEQAMRLIEQDTAEACAPLAKARWAAARLLREYQLFKHNEIFDPLIARGSAEQAALARALKARCTAMGEAFGAYAKRWSSEDVAGNWAAYRSATLDMVHRLRTHMVQERRGVGTLLAMRAPAPRGAQPFSRMSR